MQSEIVHPAELRGRLFAEAQLSVYAILDGASIPDLLDLFDRFEPQHVCLYRGEMEPDLEEAAPYLVKLERDGQFAEHVFRHGWGQHWGVFVQVPRELDINVLRRHLRRFLIVHDPDGQPLYFRYYDPRVLRVFLPTCDAEQLAEMFGPIEAYLVEDREPSRILRFRTLDGQVVSEQEELVTEG